MNVEGQIISRGIVGPHEGQDVMSSATSVTKWDILRGIVQRGRPRRKRKTSNEGGCERQLVFVWNRRPTTNNDAGEWKKVSGNGGLWVYTDDCARKQVYDLAKR